MVRVKRYLCEEEKNMYGSFPSKIVPYLELFPKESIPYWYLILMKKYQEPHGTFTTWYLFLYTVQTPLKADIINRPGVAGAVLQTPSPLIN